MSWTLNARIKDFIDEHLTSEMRKNGALDLGKFAKKIGISNIFLAEFNDDSVSGLLKKENGEWNVYVNYTDSPRRRRFTIAHEIGHFVSYLNSGESRAILEKSGQVTDFAFARDGSLTKMEAEANSIAARILMPESDVRELVEKKKNTEEIAKYFQVSESAALVRLQDLGIIPFESIWEAQNKAKIKKK